MSHAVRINAKFATPEDVADILGVSSVRAKKLASLVTSAGEPTVGSISHYSVENRSPKNRESSNTRDVMLTPMSKSKLIAYLAEKVSTKDKPVSKKQTAAFFDELFNLAVKERRGVGKSVIPGIGRAVKAHRKTRMGRNPVIRETNKPKVKMTIRVRKRRARATASKSAR